MAKQCEIVAVATSVKTRSNKALTELYKLLQRSGVFEGMDRTYVSKFEDGDQYPPEKKRLEARAPDLVKSASRIWEQLIDIVAQQDAGNQIANADIVVAGETIAKAVPAVTLIGLEKLLNDIQTLLASLPVLDPTKEWRYSNEAAAYVSVSERAKTRKVSKHTVVVPPTEHHPAVVDKETVDEVEGTWKLTEYSGAIPAQLRYDLVTQVQLLSDAVKMARENANRTDIPQYMIGKALMDFIQRPLTKQSQA